MQHPRGGNPRPPSGFPAPARTAAVLVAGAVVAGLVLGGIGGCDTAPAPSARGGKARPFEGVALTVGCPDPAFAAAVTPMARAWAAREGATVRVTADPLTPESPADAAVVGFADLGTLVARGELVPVPAEVKAPGHPYQWLGVMAAYQTTPFAGWGSQTYGLPLAGDAAVLVYRADRLADPTAVAEFKAKTGRELGAPATWEDFAAAAAFFAARDGRPAVPAAADDQDRLTDLFFRIAACYDRPAQTAAQGSDTAGGHLSSFLFDPQTGAPRLTAPGFRIATERLAELNAGGGAKGGRPADPVAALAPAGGAVFAVVSLAELARLRDATGAVPARYGIAPLPGGRVEFDGDTPRLTREDPQTKTPVPVTGVNYVPFFGRGKLGVVRARCPRPDAAFDLLAEIGGPARSQELVGNPDLGAGPFRDVHLDRERQVGWLGYGLDRDRTLALQDAVRRFVGREVRNPVYGLRDPDHVTLTRTLAEKLKPAVARAVPFENALKGAADAWMNANPGVPPEQLREWRRRAAGL